MRKRKYFNLVLSEKRYKIKETTQDGTMSIFKFLFSEVDDDTNDRLGAYPEKVHVRAMPERRYLKTSRIMTFVATALLCMSVMLTFVIYILSPQLRSEPVLLKIDKRFYKLEPVENSVVVRSSAELLTEEHIKQYLLLRHTIVADIDEMQMRWNEENSLLKWFSDQTVFSNFLNEKEINLARMAEGLTTEINIRFVQRVSGGVWLAEFEKIEHMPEEELPKISRWRALLEVGFKRRAYPNRDERIKNPLYSATCCSRACTCADAS